MELKSMGLKFKIIVKALYITKNFMIQNNFEFDKNDTKCLFKC